MRPTPSEAIDSGDLSDKEEVILVLIPDSRPERVFDKCDQTITDVLSTDGKHLARPTDPGLSPSGEAIVSDALQQQSGAEGSVIPRGATSRVHSLLNCEQVFGLLDQAILSEEDKNTRPSRPCTTDCNCDRIRRGPFDGAGRSRSTPPASTDRPQRRFGTIPTLDRRRLCLFRRIEHRRDLVGQCSERPRAAGSRGLLAANHSLSRWFPG
jgi:hypothetical protein